MKISDLTIKALKEFISGDNNYLPKLSGPKILELYNQVGFKDIYDRQNGGMPGGVSRNQYVFDKTKEINGSKELKQLLEIIINPRHFAIDRTKNIEDAVNEMNLLLVQDGFSYAKDGNGIYKITGADLPDEIQVEIHFEDIRSQIVAEIKKAKFLIWIAVAWITDGDLLREVYKRKGEGVNVQIVTIDDEINQKFKTKIQDHFESYLKKPEGKYANIMHHKFCVIDLKTVIHGSYNWTIKAQYNNETATVNHSKELAETFAEKFMDLKK